MIKIQYLNQSNNKSAGYKLRAKCIAELIILEKKYEVIFSNNILSGSSVVIVIKNFGVRFIIMTLMHKIFGRKIIYDLCDIIKTNKGRVPKRLILMCKLAHAITVSSEKIAANLSEYIKLSKINVIDDIAEVLEVQRNQIKKNCSEKKLLYFGNELNTGKQSFQLLKKYAERMPNDAEMVLCSNNWIEYERNFKEMGKVTYKEWNELEFKELLDQADIIILPFMDDERNLARSSNRLTLALAAKKLVLANSIPSYTKYQNCYIELTIENFEEIINKEKDKIVNISRLLTQNFEANKHNLQIINSWKKVINKIME